MQDAQGAIELEKTVNQSRISMHTGTGEDDTHYLNKQVKALKELSDLLTKIKRAGDSVGLHIMLKIYLERSTTVI